MMDARRADRVRQRHSVIDHVEDDLECRRDNARSAARARYEQKTSLGIEHYRRRHCAQHALAWCNRIGLALNQAEHVRSSRLGREVVHLIVQEKPGSADEDAGAVQVIQGRSSRDGVSGSIDNRVVRGLASLGRR